MFIVGKLCSQKLGASGVLLIGACWHEEAGGQPASSTVYDCFGEHTSWLSALKWKVGTKKLGCW